GHHDAVQARAQAPKRLDGLFGAGDDDGVKTEKKSSERRGDRPKEDATIHLIILSGIACCLSLIPLDRHDRGQGICSRLVWCCDRYVACDAWQEIKIIVRQHLVSAVFDMH